MSSSTKKIECPQLEHLMLLGKINSKWGRLYKLDPYYRNIVNAHLEAYCKICNPDAVEYSSQ